jgi:hypothetical protein
MWLRDFLMHPAPQFKLPALGSAPAEPAVGSGYDPHYQWPTNLDDARAAARGADERIGQNEARLRTLGRFHVAAGVGAWGGFALAGGAVAQAVLLGALSTPVSALIALAGVGIAAASLRWRRHAQGEAQAIVPRQYDLRAERARAQMVVNALTPPQQGAEQGAGHGTEQPAGQPQPLAGQPQAVVGPRGGTTAAPAGVGAPLKLDDSLLQWLRKTPDQSGEAASATNNDWRVGT